MYWQDNKSDTSTYVVPDDIVDILFSIDGKTLAIDHAHALSSELLHALPWLKGEPKAGIHLIHVAESGNGWIRPNNPDRDVLHLSKRAKLTIRLPKNCVDQAQTLVGTTLDINSHKLLIGKSSIRKLSKSSNLFSRYVIDMQQQSEQAFLQQQHQALCDLGIKIKKMLCGKQHQHNGPKGLTITRSLMLAELNPEESVRLQEIGLGEGRKLGCGLFLAHKSIAPVMEMYEHIPGAENN